MKTIATHLMNLTLIVLFTISAAYVAGSILLALSYTFTDYALLP